MNEWLILALHRNYMVRGNNLRFILVIDSLVHYRAKRNISKYNRTQYK